MAIFNGEVVPIEIFGIRSSNKTNGHRFIKDEHFEVSFSQDYFERLDEFYVIPQIEKKDRIHTIARLSNFEKEGFYNRQGRRTNTRGGHTYRISEISVRQILGKIPAVTRRTYKNDNQASSKVFTVHKDGKITNIFVSFIDKPADIKDNGEERLRKSYKCKARGCKILTRERRTGQTRII